jgi:D-arginine dehydrogenase
MTKETDRYDVIIIGAGIAGASLAYFLTREGVTNVLVVERESQPGYHATGRSAATLAEIDPILTLQRLKILAAPFLRNPPAGFAQNPVLDERGVLSLLREPQWSAVCQVADLFRQEGLQLDLLTQHQASDRLGGLLERQSFDGAAWVPCDGFIDVHELLSSYIRGARQAGARFQFNTDVQGLLTRDGRCGGIVTSEGAIGATWVVNAAGAWVGKIAQASGALPIEFSPLRRSIVIFATPEDVDVRAWPLVWSDPHQIYFRPESGGLLFCPMDEVLLEPCDAQPDEVVIAAGIERLRKLAPRLVPRALGRRWAGLRTFSPDRVPVVGEDPRLPGFFWLAGQGGCGIETSPAVGQIAADLLRSGRSERFDATLLSPRRFAL